MTEARPLDLIHIRGLRLRTMIGFHEWEKGREQEITVDVTIHHDQTKASANDDVAETIDYARLRDEIMDHAGTHSHGLLETMAEHIARLVLKHERVEAVDVCVNKPGALRFSESVGVQIHRSR